MFSSDEIKGNWKQLQGKLKQKWADLTDDDMKRVSGNWTELEGIIQERYGQAKEKVRGDIKNFEQNFKSALKGNTSKKEDNSSKQ